MGLRACIRSEHEAFADWRRAGRRRISDQRAAMAVRSKIQRRLEVVEGEARGVISVGHRQQSSRRVVEAAKLRRIKIKPGQIDGVGMRRVGRSAGEPCNMSAETGGVPN